MQATTLLLLLLSSISLGAQPASIHGVVANAATGQPLSGAHVRLFTGEPLRAATAYGAISDRAGRFLIAALQAGSYFVSAERTGFVHLPGKRRAVTLKPGRQIVDFRIEMAPRAVIAGRVVDENGDPMRNVVVRAVTIPEDMPPSPGLVVATDDRGEFRLRGAPGKYYVEARPFDWARSDPAEVRTDGTSEAVYGPTFFPNALSKDRATVVEAVAGGDVTGIEIRLARRRSLAISGLVRGAPDDSPRAGTAQAARPLVIVQSGESPSAVNRSQGMGVRRDGTFAFTGLQPGFHRLYAQHSSGLVSQPVEVNLDTADVTNLELVLTAPGELTGTVEIAGAPDERLPAESRKVRVEPIRFGFGAERLTGGEVDKDGAFRIGNVAPVRFRVKVDPLPENAYVRTIELDGASADGDVLDLSRGVGRSRLKIVVGRNGGQLSGTVRDPEGAAIAAAKVFLVADPNEVRPEDSTQVSTEGKYTFKAIRPGKYRLFAIDPFSTPTQRPDGWKELAARAETIEIKEGERITKDLNPIEKEDADAARKP